MTYRRDMQAVHDTIKAREAAKPRYRRICAYCKKDMGPAIGNFTGDTHGMHYPPCPEAIAMGWDK